MLHRELMSSRAVWNGMLPSTFAQTENLYREGGGGRQPLRFISWALRIIYILYSLEVGIFLLILPWMGFWENNYLLYLFPPLRPVIENSFFKGAVLGLGIANILIGIHEIVHFRKRSRDISPG
jgi:hypothetical protein